MIRAVDSTTSHRADTLTSASALAMYDAATSTADKLRAAAAMADVLRQQPRPKPRLVKTSGPTDVLTAENLAVTLKRFCAIIERRNSIPILANVALKSDGARLTITSTDLDMEYTEVLRAPGVPTFATTVPAHDLYAMVRGQKGGVDMASTRDGAFLGVTVAGASAKLPALPIKGFPFMKTPEGRVAGAVMPMDRLRNPLAFVAPAISTEETRYYLNGAYMHIAGTGGLAFVATDGSRLMLDDSADTAGLPSDMAGVILPLKSVSWILSHLTDAEVEVEVWETMVRLTTATGTCLTKVIDGNFPDYTRLGATKPTDDLPKVEISDTAAFASVLAKAAAYSKCRAASIRLTVTGAGLQGVSRNMEGGRMEVSLPAKVSGEPFDLSFNARLMRDLVIVADEVTVAMPVGGDFEPAILTWAAHPGRRGLIMPLRT